MIKLTVNGALIEADSGENLSALLIKHSFTHPRPCGGRGVCGKCTVLIDGVPTRACKYTVTHDITVEVDVEGSIASESGLCVAESGACATELALDIGTTTLALALLAPAEKKVLRVMSFNNPQRAYGADVISRIEYAQKNGMAGVREMAGVIQAAVSEKIEAILAEQGRLVRFEVLHVAGNATMLHLLLGADPTPMGVAPYTPAFTEEAWLNAADYGIRGVEKLHLLPSIAAFVGADLVAGVNLVGLPSEKYRILLDLGTNAEVLLFSKDKILATAAAAGPCFEGANISCGMSATRGAISSYGEGGYTTIEDAPAVGICGTGLVDVIAYLLKTEEIDESGYMEDDFILAEGVKLTQGDVRQYQLAKSAVCSAILTLLKQLQVGFDEIEHLYVSGGFSAKLNVDNAVLTGLLPRELRDRFVYLGNSSLMGTVKAAFEKSDLSEITRLASYADLSKDRYFGEQFIENMGF